MSHNVPTYGRKALRFFRNYPACPPSCYHQQAWTVIQKTRHLARKTALTAGKELPSFSIGTYAL